MWQQRAGCHRRTWRGAAAHRRRPIECTPCQSRVPGRRRRAASGASPPPGRTKGGCRLRAPRPPTTIAPGRLCSRFDQPTIVLRRHAMSGLEASVIRHLSRHPRHAPPVATRARTWAKAAVRVNTARERTRSAPPSIARRCGPYRFFKRIDAASEVCCLEPSIGQHGWVDSLQTASRSEHRPKPPAREPAATCTPAGTLTSPKVPL